MKPQYTAILLSCLFAGALPAEEKTHADIRPLFPVLKIPSDRTSLCKQSKKKTSLDNFLFTVQQDEQEVGSAFLMKKDDKVWMVSNYHVVSGKRDLLFVSMNDSSITYTLPDEVQLAEDRDAFRFAVSQSNGIPVAPECKFDEVVYAFGNSGGTGVTTKNKGLVVGKGPEEIEVTCEIIPGNSGGPIVNASQEIVGMATFIITPPQWKLTEHISKHFSNEDRTRLNTEKSKTEGTRYAETRRFGLQISEIKWQSFTRDEFLKETETLEDEISAYDDFRETVLAVCRIKPLPARKGDLFSRSWVSRYERKLEKLGRYRNDFFYINYGETGSFERQYVRWIKEIAEFSEQQADHLKKINTSICSLYLSEKLDDRIKTLHAMAEGLNNAAEELFN